MNGPPLEKININYYTHKYLIGPPRKEPCDPTIDTTRRKETSNSPSEEEKFSIFAGDKSIVFIGGETDDIPLSTEANIEDNNNILEKENNNDQESNNNEDILA